MFRALGKSKIAFVLAILFGLSLFFFRGGSKYSNIFNSDNVVASVSGTPISTSKFNRTMQVQISQFGQMLNKKLSGDEIRAYQIHSLVLGSLINNAVFENEFKINNYFIDEKVLAQETKKRVPQIYNDKNKIDDLALNSFLQQQGLKIDDLVNIIDFETRSNIFEDLFFKVNITNKINNKIINHDKHIRKIEFIKFNLNEFNLETIKLDQLNESNNEILDYYNQNINDYMSNETRDISYIIIDPENYNNQFTPSDSDIKNYYDNNKKLFSIPEKRDFIQFNFKTKDEADTFYKDIKFFDSNKIIDFASKNNILYNEFKDLGSNEVLEQLSEVIFDLSKDEISKVIKSPLAYHIIILTNIISEKTKSFIESSEDIKKTLLEVELNNFISDLKNKVSEQVINGSNIKEIANSNNLDLNYIKKANNINQNNLEDDLKDQIIAKSFISNKDYVSDLIDYNNKSFLYNVDKIYPSTELDYNEISEKVIQDWHFEKKKDFITKDFENKNNNENYLKNLSSQYSFELNLIEIDKNNNLIPNNLVNNIFLKKINDHVIIFENEDVYIAKIKDIIMTNDTNNEESINLISDLKNAFGNEIIKNKKISTNDSLIDALLKQY